MQRLSASTLHQLSDKVILPQYDRNQIGTGIFHIGTGAFFRAHLSTYTDTAIANRGGNWRIDGVSLRNSDVRDQLMPQDGLFTVVEKSATDPRFRLVGSVREVMVAPEDPKGLVEKIASKHIKIVTITVTEKGYYYDPVKDGLNSDAVDIKYDLSHLSSPKSTIGFVVAALKKRWKDGLPPFTVLSCDNLSDNGRNLKKVVLDFATLVDEKLATWIEQNVPFPCTMVDRIVPVVTDEDRNFAARELGLRDEAVVLTEPFSQWVIEDHFCDGRPDWESAGAIFSSEVSHYETLKLRLLNGSHSTMAYLGFLAGIESISDCISNTAFKTLVLRQMKDEVLPTISVPAGCDADQYIQALMDRFSNPGLVHKLYRIAMDGSQKIPTRLLNPIRDQLKKGGSIEIMTAAVAAWIRFACAENDEGVKYDINDPMSETILSATSGFRDHPETTVKRMLKLNEIFGDDLPDNKVFCEKLIYYFNQLLRYGASATVSKLIR